MSPQSDDYKSITHNLAHAPTGWSIGTHAAIAVYVTLTIAIGTTAGSTVWWTVQSLREQAEDNARRTAATLAAELETSSQASAANTIRTLDVVTDAQLRAAAAAVALLIDAAEDAGHGPAYINDTLLQLTTRSAFQRIDVLAVDGPAYSTSTAASVGLRPQLRSLFDGPATGRTASPPARTTADGLAKVAAAQTLNRPLVVRIQLRLDYQDAEAAYARSDTLAARTLATDHAATIALTLAHGIELAEDAGWDATAIRTRLTAIVTNTDVTEIRAVGGTGATVFQAPADTADPLPADAMTRIRPLLNQRATTTRDLPGFHDAQQRWIAGAAALRTPGRLGTTVFLATQAAGGSLLDTAWQTTADRFATIPGISSVWIATFPQLPQGAPPTNGAAGRPQPDSRLTAAAPRAGEIEGRDAWSTWTGALEDTARQAMASRSTTAAVNVRLLGTTSASVTTATPIGTNAAVVLQSDATNLAERIRTELATTLGAAFALVIAMTAATTWVTRRRFTTPVRTIAENAAMLANGQRPPQQPRLARRGDELGALMRNFTRMTDEVLARHDELSRLVDERTKSLSATLQQIQNDVRLGRVVQQTLMPPPAEKHGCLILESRMTPANELAGDFILTRANRDQTVTAGVFDVSGKGVAAALFMVSARAALYAALEHDTTLTGAMRTANRRLAYNNELGMFVTGFIARIDTETGEFEYVCAGHEPPIHRHRQGIGKVEMTGDIPLALDEDYQFQSARGRLEPGEAIVLYTDGITDACAPGYNEFTEARLRALALDSHPRELLDRIWSAVDDFTANAEQVDDMTCIIITRDDSPAASTDRVTS